MQVPCAKPRNSRAFSRRPEIAELAAAGAVDALTFVATVCDPGGAEIERHPAARPVRVELPTPDFEAKNWTA